MINVKNLNKTYFKGKPNEIKVINNTTLELPNTGLISFLGASGSGKTTLLNTIGGLDKAKGTMIFDDVEMKNYNMSKMDAFRAKHVGYIFQNYLLLEHLSVYENLRMALSLISITNKEEVEKRIEYSLKAVGLYKFRKKPAGQLSGGQMQRVAIARALVKKCNIIIADEPTGNLDSENTIEIMNILKKISKESLVLLVTHNKEIADFYSDRIVNIKDGVVISDEENTSSGSLESADDKNIHLLDLNNVDVSSEKHEINLYTDDESASQKITIVVKNNTVYIESKSRMQIVTGENVKLVNDHKKKIESHEIDDTKYDRSWYQDVYSKNTIADFFKGLGKSFKFFFTDPKRKKLFNFVFTLIGITIGILVLLQTNYKSVDTTSINNEPGVYVLDYDGDEYYYSSDESKSVMRRGIKAGLITDAYCSTPFNLKKQINATRTANVEYDAYMYPISKIENTKLIVGELAKKTNEIVIGRKLADRVIEKMMLSSYDSLIGSVTTSGLKIVGVASVDTNSIYGFNVYGMVERYYTLEEDNIIGYIPDNDITLSSGRLPKNSNEVVGLASKYSIGDRIYLDGYLLATTTEMAEKYTLTVVGTTKLSDYMLYTNDYTMLKYHEISKDGVLSTSNSATIERYDYHRVVVTKDAFKYTIVEGTDALNNDECIVSIYSGHKLEDSVNGMRVVGLYYSPEKSFIVSCRQGVETLDPEGCVIANKLTMLTKQLEQGYFYYDNFAFEVSNVDALSAMYDSEDIKVVDATTYNSSRHSDYNSDKVIQIVELVLIVIIVVYTYFSQRAKMISEIYEIGVIRSLGGKRSRLILKNLSDNFAKTTLTTLLGYLITVLIYYVFAIEVNSIAGMMMFSFKPTLVILGIVVLYGVQLIVGAIPMIALLRKTPSEINSKYDI